MSSSEAARKAHDDHHDEAAGAPSKARVPGQGRGAVDKAAHAPSAEALDNWPNAIDVDPTKILSPVMTNQGWVCPADPLKKG